MAPVASKHMIEPCTHPPIPFLTDKEADKPKQKGSFVKLELRFDPTNHKSKTYSFNMPVFHRGSPEEWIAWRTELDRIAAAIPLETMTMKFAMVKSLL